MYMTPCLFCIIAIFQQEKPNVIYKITKHLPQNLLTVQDPQGLIKLYIIQHFRFSNVMISTVLLRCIAQLSSVCKYWRWCFF